jgi:hypothetical protein
MLAACAAIIAFNIFRRDEKTFHQTNPSEGAKSDSAVIFKTTSSGLLQMYTEVWSPEIATVTGYPVDSLRPLLFRLGTFISENL